MNYILKEQKKRIIIFSIILFLSITLTEIGLLAFIGHAVKEINQSIKNVTIQVLIEREKIPLPVAKRVNKKKRNRYRDAILRDSIRYAEIKRIQDSITKTLYK